MLQSYKKIKKNGGMTYVELIVVLSIFAIMTSMVLFNYNTFQSKVDIKNLASDVASQIVQAQKDALSGKLQPAQQFTTIVPNAIPAPAYGVYFDPNNNKQFIYFADLNNDGNNSGGAEILNTIQITKGNYISEIDSYLGSVPRKLITPISITFKRPDSSANFLSTVPLPSPFDYIQITVTSSSGSVNSYIEIYPSGRIQIN